MITIVGCGTAVPDKERVSSGYYVETGGIKLLLDCGVGIVHNLARYELDWRGLSHLVISHFHNDHIGDVPALFFAWKWGMLPARSAPLHVIAPAGMRDRLEHMSLALGDHVTNTDFAVTVDEIGSEEQRFLNDVVHLRTLHTPHTPESLAYRIDGPQGSVGYTGDTGYSEQVAVFFSRVDYLIMECSLPDDIAIEMHLTPATAARMAQQANPGALIITHVYPQLDRARIPSLIRDAGWAGRVIVAYDGMVIG